MQSKRVSLILSTLMQSSQVDLTIIIISQTKGFITFGGGNNLTKDVNLIDNNLLAKYGSCE